MSVRQGALVIRATMSMEPASATVVGLARAVKLVSSLLNMKIAV